jgi:AcrR family transcriptional regulator
MNARLPAAQRRTQLLQVALETFSSTGYSTTTMDLVAQRAGVTKPVLYQHFTSKHSLFLELLRDVGNRLESMVAEATAHIGTPRQMVKAGISAYFQFVFEHPLEFQLLFGDGVRSEAEFAALVAQVESEFADFIGQLITIDNMTANDRMLLAHGIVGLAEATAHYVLADLAGHNADDVASRVADLLWSGLRGHPEVS